MGWMRSQRVSGGGGGQIFFIAKGTRNSITIETMKNGMLMPAQMIGPSQSIQKESMR
jgi:hypothetical protein